MNMYLYGSSRWLIEKWAIQLSTFLQNNNVACVCLPLLCLEFSATK